MSAHDSITTLSADADQVPAHVRRTALHQALTNASTATAALTDLSAALREAGAHGLAWGTDYITDEVRALAGSIAELVKTEQEPTGPADQVEDDHARAD